MGTADGGQGMLNRSPRASARDLDRYIGVNLAFPFNFFLFFFTYFLTYACLLFTRFIRDRIPKEIILSGSFHEMIKKFPFVRVVSSSRNLIVSRTGINSIDRKE